MIKGSRIPVIPLNAGHWNKSINGELMVDIDNKCLKIKDNNGDIINLNGANSEFKTGRINMIKGTAFNDRNVPDNFSNDGFVLLSQSNGSLIMNYMNNNSQVIIELTQPIEKDKFYTIGFYAKSTKDVTMNIILDSYTSKSIDITTSNNYYTATFDTSTLSTDKISRIYLEVNEKSTVTMSKLILEEGETAGNWIETATYNLTINKLVASNIDVLDALTIKGEPLVQVLQGLSSNLIVTADDIVTSDEFIEEQSVDSNYDTVSVSLEAGINEVICNKTFKDLLYGSYYVILRVKTSSNTYEENPILNITTSEYIEETDTLTLLSSTDIYETDFVGSNEFEEIGFITQFKGVNGGNTKNLNITVTMIGNENNPKINIDYITIGLAAPGIIPLDTLYK